jgi:3'-phosphoadenosine 5'-phosphosulfate sulfotransferase (PAPS reductase)/FAD synthetase
MTKTAATRTPPPGSATGTAQKGRAQPRRAADPFRIDGPALVSFSGGRTSAYMLWRILQAHGGTLPNDVRVTFANTGKEMPQTLDFVRDCGERWGVEIVWLEYPGRVVTYETAARNGEPFAELIRRKKYLPNPVMRFCTQELKIRAMERYAKTLGWTEYDVAIGLRADESSRVARMRNGKLTPLASAGISKRDVLAFWMAQNFDLALPSVNGTTPSGNCDLCFLKGAATIQGLIRANPELAGWWIDQERAVGATFRKDRPSYAAMAKAVREQRNFDFGDRDELVDCFCGDTA